MLELWRMVITCEHADNLVPPGCESLFVGAEALLDSHRGYDPGALLLARNLGAAFGVKPIYSEITRLLVDLNRSPNNPERFSEFTRQLPRDDLRLLHNGLHEPYWTRVENVIRAAVEQGMPVLHISVHTFTPELDGRVRDADIGILFDARREVEKAFASSWCDHLAAADPNLRCKLNYPYNGADDGLTTGLRKRFSPLDYLGIELELNQAIAAADGPLRRRAHAAIRSSLANACDTLPGG